LAIARWVAREMPQKRETRPRRIRNFAGPVFVFEERGVVDIRGTGLTARIS
jgi:hypothetical protein